MKHNPGHAAGRRTLSVLIALITASLFFTACSNDGNEEDTANNAASSPASETGVSSDCETGPEATSASCQAAGPGRTVSAERCPGSSPTALEGGVIEGAFGPWCENAIATAYATPDTDALIPEGAEVELTIRETDMDTTVDMQVQGFASGASYTGILHEGVCTESPGDIGPEFVNQGSGDNPNSNLVLDFTTEPDGSAEASVSVPFLVPDMASGDSIVLHDANQSVVGCVRIP
ncbi:MULTISPECIES: hypothetical protein [Arthrobacter]|uniref:hypothetical protein n=1 Tax=Arthrobacter TaxID=1663 RepID=UPI001D13A62F|nr:MULTISPECIES: hypothetical protein [Arthrobacter]MCC3282388.1 hypothetical protein [Arthrobacter caoxuetaonis]MCC9194114.1 hypothetical protein [Arthrobacter sp. zg-Y916]